MTVSDFLFCADSNTQERVLILKCLNIDDLRCIAFLNFPWRCAGLVSRYFLYMVKRPALFTV